MHVKKDLQHIRQPAETQTKNLRSAQLLPVDLSSKIWDLNRKTECFGELNKNWTEHSN